jgi:hypothetical protein
MKTAEQILKEVWESHLDFKNKDQADHRNLVKMILVAMEKYAEQFKDDNPAESPNYISCGNCLFSEEPDDDHLYEAPTCKHPTFKRPENISWCSNHVYKMYDDKTEDE